MPSVLVRLLALSEAYELDACPSQDYIDHVRWHFDVDGSRLARYFRYFLAFAILLATIRAGYYFVQVLLLETKGAINPDGVTYMIVGRGILNGLLPYADLFESKPPGIFLISALSLLTTGSERLALFLQVGLLIAIPVLLAVFAWREVRQKPDLSHRYLVVVSASLIGLLLGLYLEERSGSFQPESFGAFFASLYILHVFLRRDAASISAIFINACILMASIGLKEPFVVTALAGILLITRDRRHFFHAFLVPLIVAIVVGMGALLALGYLDPYLSIYLPAMLKNRISPDPLEPLWVRGFAVGRLFGNLGARFYPSHVFGWTFALLWILAPALKSHIRSAGRLLLIGVTSVTIYLALVNTRVFLVLLRAISRLPVNVENDWGFLGLHVGKYVLILVACILLLFVQRKKRILLGNIASVVALYLTSMTVGVADYLPWHWGFAFPVLFALAILFVRYAASQSMWSAPIVMVMILITITGILFRPSEGHLLSLNRLTQNSSAVTSATAQQFDELLDRCHISTYFSEQSGVSLGFTRSSPLGPLYKLENHIGYLPPNHPLIQQTYANIHSKAELVVLGSGAELGSISPVLTSDFDSESPPCAQGLLPITNLTLLFRKNGARE